MRLFLGEIGTIFTRGIVLLGFILTAGGVNAAEEGKTSSQESAIDLLGRYPTKLVAMDANPERARAWTFSGADIFHLSHWSLLVGKDLEIKMGSATLGIGHCEDGAVWAVVVPREGGTLVTGTNKEALSHVWLRFHPNQVARLFRKETVFGEESTNGAFLQLRRIANRKMFSSWQANGKALIPGPTDMTVDVDTTEGVCRFFVVDTQAQTAKYCPAYEKQAIKPLVALTKESAGAAFDTVWEAFDNKYAMFVLRPEVDWAKAREEYRPKAIASPSSLEFAEVCAEMLKPLRDLHVWISLQGENVSVFNRPSAVNSNPSAHQAILGSLHSKGRVQWAVTEHKIGYIAIYGWNAAEIPDLCQSALEEMRDTRGLIVDVRLNGGGSENQAMEFASRFLKKEFVYAYSQFRNGPSHTNLTEKEERKIAPGDLWRYNRPVVVLIGQICMSSNESFIAMMTGDPDAITMGDHTCGSSGNPEIIKLPIAMTVSVPQWIDYLPDGTALDEHGVQPQVPFATTPEAFSGTRDDLLVAALERLRKEPLPGKPIEGAAFQSEREGTKH